VPQISEEVSARQVDPDYAVLHVAPVGDHALTQVLAEVYDSPAPSLPRQIVPKGETYIASEEEKSFTKLLAEVYDSNPNNFVSSQVNNN